MQRPECGNCQKRRVECAFLKEQEPDLPRRQPPGHHLDFGRDGRLIVGGRDVRESISSLGSTASPAGSGMGTGMGVGVGFTARDVQLMYHYSTSTCFTLSDDAARHDVWQRTVPELAFKHDFLLYGLFALAAFHRCRTTPAVTPADRLSLIALGRRYKQWGLTSYIPLMQHSSDDNCHALFAFSLLIGSLCLAELQYDYEDVSSSATDFFTTLVGTSHMWSGTLALAHQHRSTLRQGNLAPLLGTDLEPGSIDTFPNGLRQALESVFDAVRSNSPDLASADTDACLSALQRLGLFYPKGGQPMCSRAALIAWPVLGGKDFLDLMQVRDPLALICLAHYGAIVHQNRHVWFLDGLGAKMVSVVLEFIPVCAVKYLEWAVRTVRRREPPENRSHD
jgi:hypothetical protein